MLPGFILFGEDDVELPEFLDFLGAAQGNLYVFGMIQADIF